MSTHGGRPKSKSHSSSRLSEKTVVELRSMASKKHVKQTRSDGTHKNKAQLVAALRRADHGYHGGASGAHKKKSGSKHH